MAVLSLPNDRKVEFHAIDQEQFKGCNQLQKRH